MSPAENLTQVADRLDDIDLILTQIQTGLNVLRSHVHGISTCRPAEIHELDKIAFLLDSVGYFGKDAERMVEVARAACVDGGS